MDGWAVRAAEVAAATHGHPVVLRVTAEIPAGRPATGRMRQLERYLVLQSLYSQPADVITRFTASRTTWSDRLRILFGRPEVPAERALKSITETTVQAWADARAADRKSAHV